MHTDVMRQRGFTLIELLMTLAVLTVLAMIALPSFGGLVSRNRAAAVRGELDTALNMARMSAISRGSHVIVCPSDDQRTCLHDTAWQHGWLVFADLDHDGDASTGEPVIATGQTQPSGVAILSTAGRTHVDFHRDGSAAGTNLTLTICDHVTGTTGATSLVLNQGGRVRQGTPSAEAAAECVAAAGSAT